MENLKETSYKTNRESTELELAYIRYITAWILEDTNRGVGHNTNDRKYYWQCKEDSAGKGQWVYHKP